MARRLIHTILKHISSFLFPERCFGCGKEGELFCDACAFLYAEPARTRLNSGVIVASVFRYQAPPARNAIRAIKYRRVKTLTERIGDICAKHAIEFSSLFPEESVTVVPVPLSSKTKRIRGYNHSEVIAKKIAERCGWNTEMCALEKIKYTPSQTTFRTKTERKKNIKNSLAVSSRFSAKEKTILLVDDVLTSGATLNECARVLQDAGAKKIYGIVVAKG